MIVLPPPRWMTEYRSDCVVEREYQKKLGATNKHHYAQLLQQQGLPLVAEDRLLVPKITISVTDNVQTPQPQTFTNDSQK